ncbi:hypothetical protein [Leifsonia lichenia]
MSGMRGGNGTSTGHRAGTGRRWNPGMCTNTQGGTSIELSRSL